MSDTALLHLETSRKMPLLMLPLRTTAVALKSGRVLYAPASTLSEDALRDIGEVTDVVMPNLFHGEGTPNARAAHPNARFWGPAGIREKQSGAAWHGELGVDPWPHQEELPLVVVDGMPGVRESVLFHRATRTLLVADLVFNMRDERGLGAFIILHLFGTYGRFGISRLFLRMVKDRVAFEASSRAILEWDFERIIPAHGAIVESGGKPMLEAALAERGYGRTR